MATLFDEEFDDALRFISNTRMSDRIKRQHIQINIEGYYTSVLVDCFAEIGFYDPKSKAITRDFSAWETLRENLCSQKSKYSALETNRLSKIRDNPSRDESSDDDDECPITQSCRTGEDRDGEDRGASDGSCSGSEMVSF
jgi:hypothetical protein